MTKKQETKGALYVGTVLSNKRYALKMTEEALAKAANISAAALRSYEGGQRMPPLDQAYRLSEALDLSLHDMLGAKENMRDVLDSQHPTVQRYELELASMQKTMTHLRQSERRWRQFAEASLEGVCLHDGLNVVDVNEQFVELFGYSHQGVLGKPILDFIAPTDRASVADALTSAKAKRSYVASMLDSQGKKVRVRLHARTLPDGLHLVVLKPVRLEAME